MDILELSLGEIHPYEKNPRKNDSAVEYVANSIKEFGFKVPIVIDKDNIIVCGHTRYKAAQLLKMSTVPCIKADDLTEDQIKAFRLADNKVSEKAEWDFPLLNEEMEDIFDINMEDFGFDQLKDFDIGMAHEEYAEETQDRVENILNLGIGKYRGAGPYDIPIIEPVQEEEIGKITDWIQFSDVLTDNHPEGKGVHFFMDDYKFERIWNNPRKYVEKLSEYSAVMSPDFSPYSDMPQAAQIFNHYRKHWVGAFLQDNGVKVVPTIRASADERSLEWYLDGEPQGGVVSISSMWINDEESLNYFKREYMTMYNALQPKKIFVYGDKFPEDLPGNVERIQTTAQKLFRPKENDNG